MTYSFDLSQCFGSITVISKSFIVIISGDLLSCQKVPVCVSCLGHDLRFDFTNAVIELTHHAYFRIICEASAF